MLHTARSATTFRAVRSATYRSNPEGWLHAKCGRATILNALIASSVNHPQAATLAQAGVVGWPVRHPAPRPRNMTTAVLVQLEWKRKHPEVRRGGELLLCPASQHQPADPCTTLAEALVQLERQGGHPGAREGRNLLHCPRLQRHRQHPCNNAKSALSSLRARLAAVVRARSAGNIGTLGRIALRLARKFSAWR